MLNFPLGDAAALRLVGWTHTNSGYIDNIRFDEKDANEEKVSGGRAMLLVNFSDSFRVTASAMIQSLDLDNDSRITPSGVVSLGDDNPIGGTVHVNGAVAMPTVFGGDNISTEFVRTPWDEKAGVYSLTAEWDLSNGSLTATTNLFSRDINYIYDSTPILQFFGAPTTAITNQIQDRKVYSTEVRYASNFDGNVNFVVGALYQKDEIDFDLQVLVTDETGRPIGTFSQLDADDFFIGNGSSVFGRTLSIETENNALLWHRRVNHHLPYRLH